MTYVQGNSNVLSVVLSVQYSHSTYVQGNSNVLSDVLSIHTRRMFKVIAMYCQLF